MLSEKIKLLFIQKGFIPLTEEERQEYTNVLIDLNIPLDSIFAEFNLATLCGSAQCGARRCEGSVRAPKRSEKIS